MRLKIGFGILCCAWIGGAGSWSGGVLAAPAGGVLGPAVRTPLRGVVSQFNPAPAQFASQVRDFTIAVRWADLEPAAGALQSKSVIDEDLVIARQRGSAVRLRVLGGVNAPDWAKRLDGPPVTIAGGTIGRFWTPRYAAAYDTLQRLLATRYGGEAALHEVVIARCETLYDEPFNRQAANRQTVRGLLGAGFTAGADELCLRQQIDSARVWPADMNVALAFNTYDHINPDGSWYPDEAFTESMMRYCRQVFGGRCELGNNSVSSGTSPDFPLYRFMRTLGHPITLQLNAQPGNIDRAVAISAQVGAASLEVLPSMLGRCNLPLANALLGRNA